MSKIRMNIKRKSNVETKVQPIQTTPEVVEKTAVNDIQYYLNKDVNSFTTADLHQFKISSQKMTASFFEKIEKVNDKLFELSKIEVSETKIEPKKTTIDFTLLPQNFISLKSLLEEVLEDNSENISFVKIILTSLIEVDKNIENQHIDLIYNSLTKMLENVQTYRISQQKYIYKSISNCINNKISAYHFISPEDGGFVDSKLHKIVSGQGQRIERGLSYILLNDKDEVLKLGNVKTV